MYRIIVPHVIWSNIALLILLIRLISLFCVSSILFCLIYDGPYNHLIQHCDYHNVRSIYEIYTGNQHNLSAAARSIPCVVKSRWNDWKFLGWLKNPNWSWDTNLIQVTELWPRIGYSDWQIGMEVCFLFGKKKADQKMWKR